MEQQLKKKEKMARRVREFRVEDVWVVQIVGWEVVWCEWKRTEGRLELGLQWTKGA